jgi:hypothetical protein
MSPKPQAIERQPFTHMGGRRAIARLSNGFLERRRTVLPAFTLMDSPVRGFSPFRAFVLRTMKVPKLGKVKRPFFFNSRTIASMTSVAARFAATPVVSADSWMTWARNAFDIKTSSTVRTLARQRDRPNITIRKHYRFIQSSSASIGGRQRFSQPDDTVTPCRRRRRCLDRQVRNGEPSPDNTTAKETAGTGPAAPVRCQGQALWKGSDCC